MFWEKKREKKFFKKYPLIIEILKLKEIFESWISIWILF